jgi:metal-sulfur cluster biosynthetic enzyme
MTTDAACVRRALTDVLDPCSLGVGRPTNIVSMGLVDAIEVRGDQVTIRLLLTDPSCFFYRDLARHIDDAVSVLPEVGAVRVELVQDKLWEPGRSLVP